MKSQFNEILFFTATNLNWMPLLQSKTNKNYILDCLNYLSKNDKSRIYAFVIMPNHVHLILDLISMDKSSFQNSFLGYTAKQCLNKLKNTKSQKNEKCPACNDFNAGPVFSGFAFCWKFNTKQRG